MQENIVSENNKKLCVIKIDYNKINKAINEIKSISDGSGFFVIRINEKLSFLSEDLTSFLEYVVDEVIIEKYTELAEDLCFKIKSQIFFPLIKKLTIKTNITLTFFSSSLVIEQEKNNFTVFTGSYKYEDNPIFPNYKTFFLKKNQVLRGIDTVSFSSAKESLEHFNGVFLSLNNTSLKIFAADKSRLAVFEEKISVEEKNNINYFEKLNNYRGETEENMTEKNKSEDTIIFIKKKAINSIEKFLSERSTICQFVITPSCLFVLDENFFYRTALGSTKEVFNYETIIMEKSVFAKMLIKKTDIKSSLSRMSILSNSLTYYVILTVKENTMEISTYDPNSGFFKEEINIEPIFISSSIVPIKLNIKYLIESLNHMEDNIFTMVLQKNGPTLLLAENLIHCLMPIKGI